jgi:hypothetical protein
MFQSSEAFKSMGRIWLECVGLVLLIGILLAGGLYIHLFVHVVPPISGKVVDAITGQPVPGMKVCLQVDSDVLDQVPRKEVSRSSGSGKFFVSPSVYDRGPRWTPEGYSIRVTDPENDLAVPCGSVLGPGLNEVHSGQQVNHHGDTAGYFPVVLVKQGDSVRIPFWLEQHAASDGIPVEHTHCTDSAVAKRR